jgi:hypothetical protein
MDCQAPFVTSLSAGLRILSSMVSSLVSPNRIDASLVVGQIRESGFDGSLSARLPEVLTAAVIAVRME